MFLSTRWGKPSYEIRSLPISEFNRQKLFWEHCTWGVTDDILALHHSNYMSMKSGGKAKFTVPEVKRMSSALSATKAFVIESTKGIRAAFMGIAKLMAGRGK